MALSVSGSWSVLLQMKTKLTTEDLKEIAAFHAVCLAYIKMQRLLDKDKDK